MHTIASKNLASRHKYAWDMVTEMHQAALGMLKLVGMKNQICNTAMFTHVSVEVCGEIKYNQISKSINEREPLARLLRTLTLCPNPIWVGCLHASRVHTRRHILQRRFIKVTGKHMTIWFQNMARKAVKASEARRA